MAITGRMYNTAGQFNPGSGGGGGGSFAYTTGDFQQITWEPRNEQER